MKEILWLGLATGLLFIVFLTVMIFGIVNKNRAQIIASACIFAVTLGVGIYTVYQFASKTFGKMADVLRPRTGLEIYTSRLGLPAGHCVHVINSQTQILPRADGVWLEFQTCPLEVARIAAKPTFKPQMFYTHDTLSYYPAYGPRPAWWTPYILGDSVLVLRDAKYINRGKVMIVSKDSSYGFFCDMPD